MIEHLPFQLIWHQGEPFVIISTACTDISAYLVRHEILALHQRGKPQAYPVCFQAQLSGTGTARPTDTAKFPDAYNINPEFKNYNVFDMSQDHSQFIFPGPPVYGGGAGPAAPGTAPAPASSSVAAPALSSAPTSDAGQDDTSAPAPTAPSSDTPVTSTGTSSPVTSAGPPAGGSESSAQ